MSDAGLESERARGADDAGFGSGVQRRPSETGDREGEPLGVTEAQRGASTWYVAVRLRLGDLDLHVEVGGGTRPVALIGPNGSGKTTLLRTIAGAYHPNAGIVRLGDRVVFDAARGIDLPPETRRVGYVPQGYGLFPHLSAVDNVAFGVASVGGEESGRARAGRRQRAKRKGEALELMERLECVHVADRPPASLSGGEQQRVALARSLMIEPEILLLDEPLAALDAPARRRLRAWLSRHLEERAGPSLVVSHDVRDVRALGADVYVLEGGRIVQKGSPDALAAGPATDFVAEFFA